MSLFSGFVDAIKGLVSPLIGEVGQSAANIGAQQIAGTAAPATVQGLQQAATKTLQEQGASKPGQAATDVLLRASKPVAEAFSYGVNRPVSTLGLLSDPTSPINQDGFQISDVTKAWNRSQVVSPFQAMTKSVLFQDTPIGQLSDSLLQQGNINLKKVNLWDDKDVQKNFVDNTVGRWFTGTGDFVLSNAAGGGVTKLIGGIAKGVVNVTNLTTSIQDVTDLAKMDSLADAHITHFKTNGVMGTQTNFGSDVVRLSQEVDAGKITDDISAYSTNENLPKLIANVTNSATIDPVQKANLVKDFILADKGYMPAFERLQETNPADLWQLGDTNNFIKGNTAITGKLPRYEGENLKRVNAAYDDSINQVPAHKQIRDAFMDTEGNFYMKGTDYKPIDPPIVGGLIGKARTRMAELSSAAAVRDFTGIGGIAETVLGGGANRPTTVLLHFFGTKLPRGYISFSGLRPFDHVDEVNAVFDDIPLFKNGQNQITTGYEMVNGQSLPIKISASEYRQNIMSRLANATNASDKAAIIEELDSRLGEDIARSRGITNMEDVQKFTQDARSSINSTHNDLIRQGYSFDAQGNRLQINVKTQRQIADTLPMLPWGNIDRELMRLTRNESVPLSGTATVGLHEAGHSAFDTLNRVFSLSVLGRPAYVPKNSVIEPLVSASLAMGHMYWEDSVGTTIANGIKNNKNRILGAASKITDAKNLRSINKQVSNQFDRLNEAYHIRDNAYAQYEEAFNSDALSPATKAEHSAAIKADLREAQNLVNRLELEIGASVKRYGTVENIPSVYGLRRRIDFLKAQDSARYASEIRTAEIALQKAIGDINTLNPEINNLNKGIEDAWKLIDKTVESNKLARAEQADILLKKEGYKKRFYGKQGPVVHNIGGNIIEDSSLYDPQKFGDAMRSEFSNADTAELSVINELRTGSKVNILARKSPTGITDVTSPMYFEELAYVINRQFRGDELVDQILADANPTDIMEWANSPKGLAYFREFGKNSGVYSKADIADYVNSQINTIRRYIPDPVVRAEVLKAPATPAGLQKLLADKLDILSPIHPTDIDYGSAATLNKFQMAGQTAEAALNGFWKKLAGVENPFRWTYGDKRFYQIQDAKLNLLHSQGVPITAEQVNATRLASARETLADTEKTFYTIRRNQRPIYAARTVASFPSASINALYRFGRLAVVNPARTALFLKNYNSMYESFGVDKNGNKVENPSDAVYIVVPGTKEFGIGGEQGIRLSAKTVGFLANTPGPSWLATFAVGKFLEGKPSHEDILKSVINQTVGHIPGMDYASLFPQGATTDLKKSFVPGWMQDLSRYLRGTESDADFLNTFKMIHKYNSSLFEIGLVKKMPSFQDELNQTKEWYGQRAIWKFASPFGITPQLDRPGQMLQDMTAMFQKKNNGDFDKTTQDVLKALGPAYSGFPVDRYLYKGQSRTAYIDPSMEGYKRVWDKYSGLATQLAKIDPTLVGLLTADVAGDPNAQVQKFLADPNVKLPDGTKLNKEILTPQQWETNLQVNRTWDMYRATKQSLLEQVKKAGYNRISDSPEAQAAWTKYLDQLSAYNKDWGTQYKQMSTSDVAYTYAQGFKYLENNPKFKSDNKNSEFFKQVQFFNSQRDKLVNAYKDAPKGYKTGLQAAWVNYLQETTAGMWVPEMQQIIDRYFINDKLTETL